MRQRLALYPSVDACSRVRPLRHLLWGDRPQTWRWTEVFVVLVCGAVSAALVLLVEIKLQMPGHAILRALFVMSFGMAIVPRPGAGTLMGFGAMATAALCGQWGLGKEGLGSLAGLCLTGPCLDLAASFVRKGFSLYLALPGAGLLANLLAFGIQYSDKVWHWTGRGHSGGGGTGGGSGGGSGRGLAAWLSMAVWTYPLLGILAGLFSTFVWFRWTHRDAVRPPPTSAA